MSLNTSTGYGPRKRTLVFDGDERKFELWLVRFMGHLRIQKLHATVLAAPDKDVDAAKNAEAFAELTQYLDDRSLSLIMREAADDGRRALIILKEHYRPKGKPRVITLYTELTSLNKDPKDSVTDYIIRAENIAAALKETGETISDGLLVSMVLKGLPVEFKPFTTVITQKEKPLTFAEFKVALRNFEDTEKVSESDVNSSVLKVNSASGNVSGNHGNSRHGGQKFPGTCYSCGTKGHKAVDCRKKTGNGGKSSRWCEHCRTSAHDTKFCRKFKSRNSAKLVDDVDTAYSSVRPKESAKFDHCSCGGACSCSNQCSFQKAVKFDDTDKVACDTPDAHSFLFKIGDVHSFVFNVGELDSSKSVIGENAGLLVDCGATTHIVNDESKFIRFDENFDPAHHFLELADGSRSNNLATRKGDACVKLRDEKGNVHECVLQDALLVPSFSQCIFSVQSAVDRGAQVEFSRDSATLFANGTKFQIRKSGKLYYLNTCSAVSEKSAKHTLKEWHEILGHCNTKDVLRLEDVVHGMTIMDRETFDCGVCIRGKMAQTFNRKPDKRAKSCLDLVHFDLAGPIEPAAKEGFRYALGCVDDFSGLIHIYFLKQKSDTVRATEKFLADVSPFGSVKRIRSDQGGEFISEAFESLLIANKIKHERSAPHSPHQNGTVERSWRSLFEMARCLLIQSGLPKSMWTYALMAAVYTRNRCYNPRTECTPFQSFTGSKPNIAHMQKFGCTCYALVQNPKKLDDRSEKGVFVGYDKGSPAFLVYFPDSQIVRKVRCVKFTREPSVLQQPEFSDDESDEDDYPVLSRKPVIQTDVGGGNVDHPPDRGVVRVGTDGVENVQPGTQALDPDVNVEPQNVEPENVEPGNVRRYPNRVRSRPSRYDDYLVGDEVDIFDDSLNHIVHGCYNISSAPKSYQEAVTSSRSDDWQVAMETEMEAWRENDTFELTSLPPGRKAVGAL